MECVCDCLSDNLTKSVINTRTRNPSIYWGFTLFGPRFPVLDLFAFAPVKTGFSEFFVLDFGDAVRLFGVSEGFSGGQGIRCVGSCSSLFSDKIPKIAFAEAIFDE